MKKQEYNDLAKKYKEICLSCPRMNGGFTSESVKSCSSCKRFSKEDMALLLYGYYESRHTLTDSSKLGLPDKVLDRIFELHYSGVSKFSIVKMINSEFPRRVKGKKKDWVNWKQVHWVIENRYTGKDARTRIASSRSRIAEKLGISEDVPKEIEDTSEKNI